MKLKRLKYGYWHPKVLSYIVSVIGHPIYTDSITVKGLHLDFGEFVLT